MSSSDRFADAIRRLWPDAQEVFAPLRGDDALVRDGLLPERMSELHAAWQAEIRPVLEPLAGELPAATPSVDGRQRRTPDFAWLHGEFTRVAHSELGALW